MLGLFFFGERELTNSDVVVQREFVRMRPQPNGIRLVLALVLDERLDQIFAKDIAPQQELVIVSQAIQSLFE
jgi:hypothetical protein